jgi:hypothetical protein
MIFYTNFGIQEGLDGCARGPFIFIRPEFRDNYGLIEHEKVHVKQFWRTFGLHGLFLFFSKKYKLKSEIEAYHRQMDVLNDHSDGIYNRITKILHDEYDLGLTFDEIMTELRNYK